MVKCFSFLFFQKESEAIGTSSLGGQRKAKKLQQNGKYLKNAIKTKSHLQKLLAGLPIPSSFNYLMLAMLICAATAFATALAQYFVYRNVFQWILHEFNQVEILSDWIVNCFDASTWIIQAILFNRNAITLAEVYPAGLANETQFFDWTIHQMAETVKITSETILEVEIEGNKNLIYTVAMANSSFHFLETNYTLDGIALETAYSLVLYFESHIGSGRSLQNQQVFKYE